jgi:hypothetical protein
MEKTLIAAKVDRDYHAKAHSAAKTLDTSVAAIIKAAMDRAIKKAAKVTE